MPLSGSAYTDAEVPETKVIQIEMAAPMILAVLPLRGYELREQLSSDGMGVVFKAWHVRTDRVVAPMLPVVCGVLRLESPLALLNPPAVERLTAEAEKPQIDQLLRHAVLIPRGNRSRHLVHHLV
ncbi:hypothetical protein PX52LOC_03233 [Limnoglobus roseus]|uniref:Uncharacterized protein n=1 Tax=Limnoglobus roseus TaxID=2598579 RepID=A0A5C1AF00_9BACT|nr:hypothetical protein PX52LOC_03233 [Limnoglobus roseus]